MEQITIRRATVNDLPAIYEFICQLEEMRFDFERFSACFHECLSVSENYYLIAEAGGNAIGYLSCHGQVLLHHCNRVYEIQELFVTEAYRSKGVGKRLLAAMEDILSTKEYDVLEGSSNMRRKMLTAFHWQMALNTQPISLRSKK